MNLLSDPRTLLGMSASRSTRCVPLLFFAFAVVVSGPTLHAQPVGSHRNSLQWLTVEADVIVRGTLSQVTSLVPGTQYPEYYRITIEPQEIIKGESSDQFSFVSRYTHDVYEELLKTQHAACFFLISSRSDFSRTSSDYFFMTCPWMCEQFYDLDADTFKAVSFDASGIHNISSPQKALSLVRAYTKSLDGFSPLHHFSVREPDRRAFTGYDSHLSVPLNQDVYAVAAKWSQMTGNHARVGKEILAKFTPIIDFETAKSRFGDVPQVPTVRQYASTLSIESLEWMATDCDLIVKGIIADSVLVTKGDPHDRTSYYKTLDRHLVKLQVTEYLKGEGGPSVSFVINNGGKISQWQEERIPIVVFLRDLKLPVHDAQGRALIAIYGEGELDLIPLRYIGRGADVQALISFDTDDQRPFLSMDLTLTNEPQKMLEIVKHYLEKVSEARRPVTHKTIPWYERRITGLKKGTPWEGDQYVGFRFPINNYLEESARRWVQSADPLHRWLGVCGLTWFKSERNAEILKARLNDPAQWEPPVYNGLFKVTYLIRWEAWKILTAWGYDVPEVDFGRRK